MKRNYSILSSLLVSIILITSCGRSSDYKPEATGKSYEVFVVIPTDQWNADMGDTLRALLLEQVPLLNQREPHFDVVQVLPGAFEGTVARHRNVIIVNVGAEYAEPSIAAAYDVYSRPQVIMEISGPTDSAVTSYIWERREEIQKVIDFAERDRYVAQITKQTNKKISEDIFQNFGFKISIPKEYIIRDSSENFMWVSYELPLASQGVVIYSYPYTAPSDFELDSLISKRNQFVAKIPGPVDNSHMTTASVEPYVPILRHVRIEGRFWAELSGFWDVHGDFMGGPFRSFSTLDVATRRVICIDTYVFAPNGRKRNYVRQLENLIYTAKFEETASASLESIDPGVAAAKDTSKTRPAVFHRDN